MIVALPRLMTDLGVTASAAPVADHGVLADDGRGHTDHRLPAATHPTRARSSSSPCRSVQRRNAGLRRLAPGFALVLVGRVVQAVGTAIMLPLLMTTVLNLVPPSSRGRMMGRISIVIGVAPALGPAIGGIHHHALDWHSCLLVRPADRAGLPGPGHRLAQGRDHTQRHPDRRACQSILSALGFGGLVYGLSSIGEGHEGRASCPRGFPSWSGWSSSPCSSPASFDCSGGTRRCWTSAPSEPDLHRGHRDARGRHDGAVRHADRAPLFLQNVLRAGSR